MTSLLYMRWIICTSCIKYNVHYLEHRHWMTIEAYSTLITVHTRRKWDNTFNPQVPDDPYLLPYNTHT